MGWTLVTGGAKRLGKEICLTLARRGHSVVIHYNTSSTDAFAVQNLCKAYGVKAETVQGDFSTPASTEAFCKAYLERFGDTQNLVNNVGNFLVQPALETPVKDWLAL